MLEFVDLIMPAVCRPEITRRVLDSLLAFAIPSNWRVRLLVNVDPMGSSSQAQVEAMVQDYTELEVISGAVVNKPVKPSLNAAIRWLFSQCEGDAVLYVEDDTTMLRPVDTNSILQKMRAEPEIGQVQFPFEDLTDGLPEPTVNVALQDLGDGYCERTGRYAFSLQPSLMRVELCHALADKVTDDHDPELCFQSGGGEELAKYRFLTAGKPGDGRAQRDIGMDSRLEADFCKVTIPGEGTRWQRMPERKLYGLRVRAVSGPYSEETWRDCEQRKWRPDTFKVFDRFLRPDMSYFDVGAWVGTTALYAAAKVARVAAFEPDPASFRELSLNMKFNPSLRARMRLFDKAIGEAGGVVQLQARGDWGSSYTSAVAAQDGPVTQVHTMSLVEALNALGWDRVHYIKLIVQGMEPELLAYNVEYLRLHRPILHITVQPHLYQTRNAGLNEVFKALSVYENLFTEKGKPFEVRRLMTTGDMPEAREIILVAKDGGW